MLRPLPYDGSIETLTFLSTDIEGSTSLLRKWGDDVYSTALAEHHRIIRESLQRHGGHEEGTQGDSFFATFTAPRAAVAAAAEMQRALAEVYWPAGEELRVRMAVHTGEAAETATGLVGYEVHRAARIAAVGYGGQILLSSAAAGLVEDTLEADLSLRNLGSHRLKDLGRPETIFQLVAPGLRGEFPPLRSLDNPDLPNNLPTSLSPFIGRAQELEEVRALVLASRLVTLTGAGGSGKTRLALQAAAELLDGSGEGVWMVELAPLSDPEQLPGHVLEALQIRPDKEKSQLDSLLSVLREQNVLLVLDNCEHLIDSVAKLADLVARSCPKVRLIATSREPLGIDGEEVYRVRSLSLPATDATTSEELLSYDSVSLFVTRARSHDKSFTLDDAVAPTVASICARLDGIPLAIELAAARLSSMSPNDLHRRLDQRFRLLTGGSRNVLPRQQTLGAMVAWSFDLLTEPELEVMRRLSVFVNGFDLEAAEAICATDSIDSFDVADLLASLVNKSLVIADRSGAALRYRLLETIRQYAAEQLLQVGREIEVLALRRRHAEYFLELCERGGPSTVHGNDQIEWLDRLAGEWDNILAALAEFRADPEGGPQVLRLIVATFGVIMTRHFEEMWTPLAETLQSATNIPLELRAVAQMRLGQRESEVPSFDLPDEERLRRQNEDLSAAVDLARQVGDRATECEALAYLSGNYRLRHDDDKARSCAVEAVEIARELNDSNLLALAHYFMAWTEPVSQPHRAGPTGVDLLQKSLEGFRKAQNLIGVNRLLLTLSLHLEEDDYAGFVALSEEAMAIAESIHDVGARSNLLSNLSTVKFLVGDLEGAEFNARAALLEKRRRSEPPWYSTFTILTCAYVSVARGQFVRGAKLLAAGEAMGEQIVDSSGFHFSPREVELLEENRTTLIQQLGIEQFEELTKAGRRLSFDEVSRLALSRSEA